MKLQTVNPASESILMDYALLDETSLNQLIESSANAFSDWKKTSFANRKGLMFALASLLKQKKSSLAILMANEMGKPISQGEAEVEKCAWVSEHFAEHAETYLKPRQIKTEMSKTIVCHKPLGVIFAIMPWNFPCWQVFRFAAPTLMAGNVAILKHAPISTGTGNAIAELFIEAGFPQHVFQHAILDNDMAAKSISHPHVQGLSFTGSGDTGKKVGALAASHLKKSVLELGGSDPYIVFADADLDLAVKNIVASRLNNCGQVCIAAKRALVMSDVHDRLVEKIIQEMSNYQMGDPLQKTTTLGPMARKDLREKLQQQVEESIAKGAKCLAGGQIPSGKGYYYPPTLLTDVKPGMPAFDEELFGPVIAVTQCANPEQAIELANNTCYGLGASLFTADISYAEKIATDQIEAGSCFVNTLVASDPRVPFGGIKQSGFGRELSQEGILEFVNIKTIAIK